MLMDPLDPRATHEYTGQQSPLTLGQGLAPFLRSLAGKNRSVATVLAYRTDLKQFLTRLWATDLINQSLGPRSKPPK